MFICMPKINFIIHFFLEVLHFKEPCNLIDQPAFWTITREPEICQIWDWWWNINNNNSFRFKLFPGKTNDKIFQTIQKKLYFGAILGPFYPNIGKNKFLWEKRTLSVFKYSNYLPWCKRSEKTNDPFMRKIPNWRTDRQSTVIL